MKAVLTTMCLAGRVRELENRRHEETTGAVKHMQTDVLGTVSHELRSPLASIKGYTAMLLRHDKRLHRDERREFLEAIHQATDDLSIIVDRLLEMAQLESNEIHIEQAAVDMRCLVTEAIEHTRQTRRYLLATTTQPDFFTFTVQARDAHGQPADDVPLAWADQRYMRQVLDNILENALKFSPRGGTITVTLQPVEQPLPEASDTLEVATRQEPEFPVLQITIHDEGIGIPDEHLMRIFDRFQRVDTRLTREVNGLGLGLAICKRIIERHEGDLWAESQLERGSTFFIRLPIARSVET